MVNLLFFFIAVIFTFFHSSSNLKVHSRAGLLHASVSHLYKSHVVSDDEMSVSGFSIVWCAYGTTVVTIIAIASVMMMVRNTVLCVWKRKEMFVNSCSSIPRVYCRD